MFHCAYIRVTGKRRFKRSLFRVKFPWREESQPSVLGFYHLVNHWTWTWGKRTGVSLTGLIATPRKSRVVKHHHLFLLLWPIFKHAESQCVLHIPCVILYTYMCDIIYIYACIHILLLLSPCKQYLKIKPTIFLCKPGTYSTRLQQLKINQDVGFVYLTGHTPNIK